MFNVQCSIVNHPSSSPLGGLLPPPPWLSPPSVMSSSPDAAAAAWGSTFCQLTSSENWRLNLAATVQPSRLLPLAAFSISAVATFRVPRPSGDGYNAGGYLSACFVSLVSMLFTVRYSSRSVCIFSQISCFSSRYLRWKNCLSFWYC